MNRKSTLIVCIVSLGASVGFFFLFPPAISQLVLRPGFRLARWLHISETGAYLAVGIALAWVLCTLLLVGVVVLLKQTLWRRKAVFVAFAVVVAGFALLAARSRQNKEFDGTWELGFEHSDFFPSGDCWRPRYWLVGAPQVYGTLNVGHSSPAVRIRFIGNASAMGRHGHMGQYLREVQVVRVIEMSPAQPCGD